MERVAVAVPVVDQHDEVRLIAASLGAVSVEHLGAEV
jgi:hypothetical protein